MACSPGAMDLVVFSIDIYRIIQATPGGNHKKYLKISVLWLIYLVLMKTIELGHLFETSVSVLRLRRILILFYWSKVNTQIKIPRNLDIEF